MDPHGSMRSSVVPNQDYYNSTESIHDETSAPTIPPSLPPFSFSSHDTSPAPPAPMVKNQLYQSIMNGGSTVPSPTVPRNRQQQQQQPSTRPLKTATDTLSVPPGLPQPVIISPNRSRRDSDQDGYHSPGPIRRSRSGTPPLDIMEFAKERRKERLGIFKARRRQMAHHGGVPMNSVLEASMYLDPLLVKAEEPEDVRFTRLTMLIERVYYMKVNWFAEASLVYRQTQMSLNQERRDSIVLGPTQRHEVEEEISLRELSGSGIESEPTSMIRRMSLSNTVDGTYSFIFFSLFDAWENVRVEF